MVNPGVEAEGVGGNGSMEPSTGAAAPLGGADCAKTSPAAADSAEHAIARAVTPDLKWRANLPVRKSKELSIMFGLICCAGIGSLFQFHVYGLDLSVELERPAFVIGQRHRRAEINADVKRL
jgi:hypothetical protein